MLVNVLLSKTHSIYQGKANNLQYYSEEEIRSETTVERMRMRHLVCANETHHILAPVLCLSLAAA